MILKQTIALRHHSALENAFIPLLDEMRERGKGQADACTRRPWLEANQRLDKTGRGYLNPVTYNTMKGNESRMRCYKPFRIQRQIQEKYERQ